MGLRMGRRGSRRPADTDLATAWQVASLLLEYPSDELVCRVPMLREAVAGLPADVGGPLAAYLDVLDGTHLGDLQRDYVDTFDVTRKCALHLTYFTHGDTRRRGVALVRIKQTYRRSGADLDTTELPDFLPVVLEFGALHDLDAAWKILIDHRVGIEMLRLALDRRSSRWLPVIDAVRACLPVLDGEGEEALARLLAQGPPQEEVGLDSSPYAVDPRLNPRPEPFGDALQAGLEGESVR
jgi:nitrate reductase delta subunit